MALWFPRWVRKNTDLEFQRWVQAVIDRLAGVGDTGATLRNLFDANTLLKADTDNTPEALPIGEGTIVGRQSGGEIAALTAAQGRGVLSLPQTLTDGDIWYANGGSMQRLGKGIGSQHLRVSPSTGLPEWSSANSGGLSLEAEDLADGTTEHLQVTMGSTPSGVERLFFRLQDIVPEIDADTLQLTFILDDDTELTTAVYAREGWIKTNGSALSGVSSSGLPGSVTAVGAAGSLSLESLNLEVKMLSANGSFGKKHFDFVHSHYNSNALLAAYTYRVTIDTTKSIKGFRLDTDNAGDMINNGKLQVWVTN